jgi:hypothetical protein
MSEEQPAEPASEGKAASKDITPLLKGWDYEPGTINVRKVSGNDGQPKLQMRLDLGLLANGTDRPPRRPETPRLRIAARLLRIAI